MGLLCITHLRFFTRKSIEELFRKSGYSVITIAPQALASASQERVNRMALCFYECQGHGRGHIYPGLLCCSSKGPERECTIASRLIFMIEKKTETDRYCIIRSYRSGDEIKINEMFNEVFGQKRDISHWHWKYRDNPNGPSVISLAESAEASSLRISEHTH